MEIIERYKEGYINVVRESSTPVKQEILDFFEEYEQKKNEYGRKGLKDIPEELYEKILYLDLTHENFTEIPEIVTRFINLKALDLSANPFSKLHVLEKLKNLEMIFLNRCGLKEFPVEITSLGKLTTLYLAGNQISAFPKWIDKLNHLADLFVGDNEIEEITSEICNIEALIGLDLGENKITTLPPEISKLSHLVLLNLETNNIDEISEEINLFNLASLNLSNNNIKKFPEVLLKFANLGSLQIHYNLVEQLPNSIRQLTHLQEFSIGNNLSEIPETIGELKNLKKLNLSNNNLSQLPLEIGNLQELTDLDLSNNHFTEIPTALQNLKNLGRLNLDNNYITSLPLWLFDLSNLTILTIAGNKIEEIPVDISKLSHLGILNLDYNHITKLPVQVGKLENLLFLSLRYNAISSLPAEIGNLANLRMLALNSNYLTHLPPEIGKLAHLSDLSLDENRLVEYPVELANLRRLKSLYSVLNSNPLTNMPEAKQMGLVELFDYLKGYRGQTNHFVFWDIPTQMRTAFQQYLAVFPDYVEKRSGKEVILDVTKVQGGLKLSTQTTPDLTIQEINQYLEDFVYTFTDRNQETIPVEDAALTREQLFELRQFIRDLKSENQRLEDKLQNYYEKVVFLSDRNKSQEELIKELQFRIRFFESHSAKLLELAASGTTQPNILVRDIEEKPALIEGFDPQSLLVDLIHKLTRMLERKNKKELEDIHNNDLAHWLRDKYYYATDQTQSGISNKNFGELDIMIRQHNGTPVSIIEAFRLKSCGDKNTEICAHIDKLIHDYDTAGHKVNFIIVYAEAANFNELWKNYVEYVQNLNNKPGFQGRYPLISFTDTGKSNVTNIKVGLAIHNREESPIEVYHLFVNMYSER